MCIFNWGATQPSTQVRIYHVPVNRSGSNDGHLDDDVVKLVRPESWHTRHLRAAFDLKHPDRVSVLHGFIIYEVIGLQMWQLTFLSMLLPPYLKFILDD